MINNYIDKKSKNKSQKQKHILISYNPLTSHLYYKTSYKYLKKFLDFYKDHLEIIQNYEEQSLY